MDVFVTLVNDLNIPSINQLRKIHVSVLAKKKEERKLPVLCK